jgi:hypothetical protein
MGDFPATTVVNAALNVVKIQWRRLGRTVDDRSFRLAGLVRQFLIGETCEYGYLVSHLQRPSEATHASAS